jgi:hypothetical protein
MFKATVEKARATSVIGLAELSIQELYELCAPEFKIGTKRTKAEIKEKSMSSLSAYCERNKIGLVYVEDGKLMLDFDFDSNRLRFSSCIVIEHRLEVMWEMKTREALEAEENYRLVELKAEIEREVQTKLPLAISMYAKEHKRRLDEYNNVLANLG